ADERDTNAPSFICLYMCEHADWSGTCENYCNSPGICNDVKPDLVGRVSSLGPDKGASGCDLYSQAGCKGDSTGPVYTYPGVAWIGSGWNDRTRSFICY
ncbi:hypothetical protein K431DRAFT_197306, partial [Polychaeton citri CBS 116435]